MFSEHNGVTYRLSELGWLADMISEFSWVADLLLEFNGEQTCYQNLVE